MLFYRAVVYLLVALPAAAQSPAFATITIKPASAPDPRKERMQVLPNGDLIASAVPLISLLSYAYDVPFNPSPRLSPLPDWTIRERYDLEARVSANAILPFTQGSEAQRSIEQKMLQRLLAERFGLVIRVKKKTLSVYALTIAKGGPKLHRSVAPKGCGFDSGPEGCHNFEGGFGHPLNANAVDMDDLVHYIENWTDMPVVNHTALTGLFTVSTQGWAPMRLPPPPPNFTPAGNPFASLPSIFTVLGKLGLELQRQKDMVPIHTVERITRPTAK